MGTSTGYSAWVGHESMAAHGLLPPLGWIGQFVQSREKNMSWLWPRTHLEYLIVPKNTDIVLFLAPNSLEYGYSER
jgi:hypothetical protein